MKKQLLCIVQSVALSILLLLLGSSSLLGQSWASVDGGGTTSVISATSDNLSAPSMAIYNGELYAIWVEANPSANNQIHIKKYNGSSWVGTGNTSGQSQLNLSTYAASNPKLVMCNGYLYAAWQECDMGDPNLPVIHVKRYNGTSWSFVQNYAIARSFADINYEPTAYATDVELAAFNNELYATWLEQANVTGVLQVRVSKFNGSAWSSIDGGGTYGLNYNTGNAAYPPRFGVYNNKLYLSWSELNASSVNQLRVKRFDGGSTWTFVDGGGADGLNYTVTKGATKQVLASFNNKLYMFWNEAPSTSTRTKIRVKQYDETNGWVATTEGATGWYYTSTKTPLNPAFCVYNNMAYVAWEENITLTTTPTYQVHVVSFDGTNTKTFIDGSGAVGTGINQNTERYGHFPSLAEYNGDLYALWNEDNDGNDNPPFQIRAKKYPLPGITTTVDVPANNTYKTSVNLDFTVNYNKIENIAGGIPYIPITLNTGGIVNATYISGTGTKTLLFRYTVASGNIDADGITVGSAIVLPSGCTMRDASAIDASLTLNSVASTTDVLVDAVAPSVSSITRQNPTDAATIASSVVFRVTFSENVNGVDISDFSLTTTGTVAGTIASVSAATGATIDVTVNTISGIGSLRLDLKSSGTGINDTPGNPLSAGFTGGEIYTIATPGTWTGAISSDWNVADNWVGLAIPTSSTDVIIPTGVPNFPVISATSTANCHNITVNTGASLIIASSDSGTGSLIVTGTSSGTVTAGRWITADQWHIISPIVSGQMVADFLTENTNIPEKSGNRGMMDYNTSENKWNSYYPTTGASGSMDAGKGFSARISTTDGTVTFTGTLTSGNTTVPLSNAGDGWNCVGNPYPSAINMNDAAGTNNFLTGNSADLDGSYACIYVWDQDASGYKILGNSSYGTRDLLQNVLQSGQGFLVKAATTATSINFTSNMQVHATGTVLKSAETTWPGFELTASASGVKASTVVAFNEKMTKGLDPTYDAGLLRGSNGLSLYTKLIDDNGVDFAIQCLPENGMESFVIPVGLDAKAGGEVKFSATTIGLPTGSSVILEDRIAKVYTDLSNGDEYAVTLTTNSSGTGRFYIHTSNLTTGTSGLLPTETFSLKAYPANEVIWIEGQVNSSAKAYLFSTGGSRLGTFNLQEGNRNSIPAGGLATGVYLLKVTDGSKQFNTKIIIYE